MLCYGTTVVFIIYILTWKYVLLSSQSSSQFSCQLSFPIIGLTVSSLPALAYALSIKQS
jgi:hypothetical protein